MNKQEFKTRALANGWGFDSIKSEFNDKYIEVAMLEYNNIILRFQGEYIDDSIYGFYCCDIKDTNMVDFSFPLSCLDSVEKIINRYIEDKEGLEKLIKLLISTIKNDIEKKQGSK